MYGVYVHVPWCRSRCPYCAFAIDLSPSPSHDAWVAGVLRDWTREKAWFEGAPATLAFGGGTPSRATPEALARVVDAVRPVGEVSMEANPEDVDAGSLRAWRAAGVTRLSLGIQSFVPSTARRLGRAPVAADGIEAVMAALDGGFESVNVDLMFAVEGQTMEHLAEDLDLAVSLGVDHVSLYGLTIEEGTPFARRGQHTVDEDGWREMYDLANARLRAAGIARYEVSNYARPGHRSAHNEHYWRARPWAGLGPAAHGWRRGGERVANVPEVQAWSAGAPPTIERPTASELLRELLWSTLRHEAGVDLARVRALTGCEVRCPAALESGGLLSFDGGAIRLTDAGFPLADALAERLWAASEPGDVAGRVADRAYLAPLRAGDGQGA